MPLFSSGRCFQVIRTTGWTLILWSHSVLTVCVLAAECSARAAPLLVHAFLGAEAGHLA